MASKATGLPYSPVRVVRTATGTTSSPFRLTLLSAMPGSMLIVTGVAQSTVSRGVLVSALGSRSTTVARFGLIDVVNSIVLAPAWSPVTG